MISLPVTALRPFIAAILWCGLLTTQDSRAQSAAPDTLEALFQNLAKPRTLAAEFKEERHLAVLSEPLQLRGELRFVRGRGVIFSYTHPEPSVSVYRSPSGGGAPTGSPNRRVAGGASGPAMPGFLAELFEGRLDALSKSFDLGWQPAGAGGPWKLIMVPEGGLKKHLQSMTLSGTDNTIAGITLQFANGDKHVITILRTRMNPVFTDAEQQGLN